ncbi:hypothetical protein O6H91_22G033000 [Diphasiastrum complanatum]|uniref:Uncharacterized protein n=1 Tax=Diphasiastrum complanatum TaxID=34168 RepID=A0ACC2AEF4_DIPCM|nr:hypothetical protein O6H91_22G033000 [Diphasiastrum complanatum]
MEEMRIHFLLESFDNVVLEYRQQKNFFMATAHAMVDVLKVPPAMEPHEQKKKKRRAVCSLIQPYPCSPGKENRCDQEGGPLQEAFLLKSQSRNKAVPSKGICHPRNLSAGMESMEITQIEERIELPDSSKFPLEKASNAGGLKVCVDLEDSSDCSVNLPDDHSGKKSPFKVKRQAGLRKQQPARSNVVEDRSFPTAEVPIAETNQRITRSRAKNSAVVASIGVSQEKADFKEARGRRGKARKPVEVQIPKEEICPPANGNFTEAEQECRLSVQIHSSQKEKPLAAQFSPNKMVQSEVPVPLELPTFLSHLPASQEVCNALQVPSVEELDTKGLGTDIRRGSCAIDHIRLSEATHFEEASGDHAMTRTIAACEEGNDLEKLVFEAPTCPNTTAPHMSCSIQSLDQTPKSHQTVPEIAITQKDILDGEKLIYSPIALQPHGGIYYPENCECVLNTQDGSHKSLQKNLKVIQDGEDRLYLEGDELLAQEQMNFPLIFNYGVVALNSCTKAIAAAELGSEPNQMSCKIKHSEICAEPSLGRKRTSSMNSHSRPELQNDAVNMKDGSHVEASESKVPGMNLSTPQNHLIDLQESLHPKESSSCNLSSELMSFTFGNSIDGHKRKRGNKSMYCSKPQESLGREWVSDRGRTCLKKRDCRTRFESTFARETCLDNSAVDVVGSCQISLIVPHLDEISPHALVLQQRDGPSRAPSDMEIIPHPKASFSKYEGCMEGCEIELQGTDHAHTDHFGIKSWLEVSVAVEENLQQERPSFLQFQHSLDELNDYTDDHIPATEHGVENDGTISAKKVCHLLEEEKLITADCGLEAENTCDILDTGQLVASFLTSHQPNDAHKNAVEHYVDFSEVDAKNKTSPVFFSTEKGLQALLGRRKRERGSTSRNTPVPDDFRSVGSTMAICLQTHSQTAAENNSPLFKLEDSRKHSSHGKQRECCKSWGSCDSKCGRTSLENKELDKERTLCDTENLELNPRNTESQYLNMQCILSPQSVETERQAAVSCNAVIENGNSCSEPVLMSSDKLCLNKYTEELLRSPLIELAKLCKDIATSTVDTDVGFLQGRDSGVLGYQCSSAINEAESRRNPALLEDEGYTAQFNQRDNLCEELPNSPTASPITGVQSSRANLEQDRQRDSLHKITFEATDPSPKSMRDTGSFAFSIQEDRFEDLCPARRIPSSQSRILDSSSKVQNTARELHVETKASNLVASVRSFLPFVLQHQPAAPYPSGKRDVKVKALDAAKAAKRVEERREQERKTRKIELLKRNNEKTVLDQIGEGQNGSEATDSLNTIDSTSPTQKKLMALPALKLSTVNSALSNHSRTGVEARCLKTKRPLNLKQKLEKENFLKLENQQKKKEEEWRKKELEIAAKKRKKEEAGKKEREIKRRKLEEVQRLRKEDEERQRAELEAKERKRKAMEESEREKKALEDEMRKQRRMEREKEIERSRKEKQDAKAAWLAEKEAERKRKEEAFQRLKALEKEQHCKPEKITYNANSCSRAGSVELDTEAKGILGEKLIIPSTHLPSDGRSVSQSTGLLGPAVRILRLQAEGSSGGAKPSIMKVSGFGEAATAANILTSNSTTPIRYASKCKSITNLENVPMYIKKSVESASGHTSMQTGLGDPTGAWKPVSLLAGLEISPAAIDSPSMGPQSYEISPYKSDDDDDDVDDDVRRKKPIPLWARKENLIPLLRRQAHMDPDQIFTSAKTCDLFEVFGTTGSRKRKDFGQRSDSGDWLVDRVSWKEEIQYKKQIGCLYAG